MPLTPKQRTSDVLQALQALGVVLTAFQKRGLQLILEIEFQDAVASVAPVARAATVADAALLDLLRFQ